MLADEVHDSYPFIRYTETARSMPCAEFPHR
jgi:hypothetical protein